MIGEKNILGNLNNETIMDIWMSENAKNLDIILQNLKETLVLVMYVTLKVV